MHLDLDAFFAAVEQRDKPSLRGKSVCVGGIGPRGVVSTASYEARKFGARSAMPTAEARRRCPAGTAFLYPRGSAYRVSSAVVMELLHQVSPVVQQVSVDEAYVDLAAGGRADLGVDALRAVAEGLLADITEATGGLTASAGVASSKMLAKVASELDKPAGLVVIPPGEESDVLGPLSVRVIGGVGPATATRLRTFGVETVQDLQRMQLADLVSIFGHAHGAALHDLAFARDDRPVETEREAKSVSAEETFDIDVVDKGVLGRELDRLLDRVVGRLSAHGFARTVTLKVRYGDFTTFTRSETLLHPSGDRLVLGDIAHRLLGAVDVTDGLRLIGVGVSGLSAHAQEQLIVTGDGQIVTAEDGRLTTESLDVAVPESAPSPASRVRASQSWMPGQDIAHDSYGAGWVWGSGLGRVTVRFEGPLTVPGPVRTFAVDDPALHPADPPDWTR